MLKSINAKIPLSVAQHLDDRGQLNPQYLTYFIRFNMLRPIPDEHIDELSYNYTFKIDADLHRSIKLCAMDNNLPMNELLGRLLKAYY